MSVRATSNSDRNPKRVVPVSKQSPLLDRQAPGDSDMPSRRSLLPNAAFLLILLSIACSAAAGETEAFSKDRFETLQQKGALVLVDVAADWCPTCARQASIIREYKAQRPAVELEVLRVDFDDQKKWVKHFKAPRQSTLILFRGNEQVWFAVAETDPAVIAAAIDGAAGEPSSER